MTEPPVPEIAPAAGKPPAPEQRPYSLAIRRPVTMAMLFLTLIVFGWRSFQQLPVNLMPDISYPTLTVRTEYEGAAPEDVEKLVTRPLEEMLAIVSGVVEISSVSAPGISEIVLEFTWGTDMNLAQQDVRDRLDLFNPPQELTENPVILRYDPTLDPVVRVAITADAGETPPAAGSDEEEQALTAIRDAAERHLKSDLEAEPGIAQVLVRGGREEEIQILVDAERLKNLGLSLANVVDNLAQQNINLSGGRLREGRTEYLVRTLNEFETIDEIRASIITTPGGQQLRLEDVARVFMGTKEREAIVHIDGREAVELEIFKEGDANTVAVSDTVKKLLALERQIPISERITTAIARQREQMGDKNLPEAERAQVQAQRETLKLRSRTLLNRLPRFAKLHLVSDQARFIQAAIQEVLDATIQGGLLALLVLYLFLRDFKSTLIIGLSLPISILAAFIPMFMWGITLNTMSLGGLALAVGMLADVSIVVLESIFRCREEGDGLLEAASRGTSEVFGACFSAALTTVVVFFPIAFVEGVAGQLFGDLGLTVSFSILASLLTALYLIPLIYSRQGLNTTTERQVVWLLRAYRHARQAEGRGRMAALLDLPSYALDYTQATLRETWGDSLGAGMAGARAKKSRLAWAGFMVLSPLLAVLFAAQLLLHLIGTILVTLLFFFSVTVGSFIWGVGKSFHLIMWLPLQAFETGFNAFRSGYQVALTHSLRFSAVILIFVMIVAAHSAYLATFLGIELIPTLKQGEFGIRMEARAGTRLLETAERARAIEQIIHAEPTVRSVTVEVGDESNRAGSDRGENVAEFTVLLEDPQKNAIIQDEIIERLRAKIVAATSDPITFTLPALFSFNTAVELQIVGDDLTELRRIGARTLEAIDGIPGLKDAELSTKAGYPEIIVTLDRELLASKNISPGQVASRLRNEVQGEIATRFNRSGEKVDIRVRTDQNLLSSISDLNALSVTESGPPIPLRDVALVEQREGPSEIRRIAQRQVVLLTANVEGRDLGAVTEDIRRAVLTVPKPEDYEFVLGGQNRELETSYNSLQFALWLAIFLVYVVMACQFESIWHPAIVMFTVPLALIGVIYTLYVLNLDLNVMVFLGAITLVGVVVDNAIVMIDYINQLRERGRPKREAIIEASVIRLRPIIMTALTTTLGLVPMIWATGEGAELRRPMAITVVAGMASATVLTLLIIPMVYQLFGGRDRKAR